MCLDDNEGVHSPITQSQMTHWIARRVNHANQAKMFFLVFVLTILNTRFYHNDTKLIFSE